MKNIHVLPTEKSSRLYIRTDVTPHFYSNFQGKPHNIYITSDEEIKEGDWYISLLENEVYKATKETQNIMSVVNLVGSTSYKKTHFKIILTDNKDLIKDGVQAIDDDFLEWFVKNPSCENVEVRPFKNFDGGDEVEPIYKIIIPNEEPKQETLEAVAEKWLNKDGFNIYNHYDTRPSFIAGAKWQQEQDKNKYSEEEVLEILNEFSVACYSPIEKFEIPEWFKKFKKK